MREMTREQVVGLIRRQARAYQPMWRLGDWPSRYRAAEVVELKEG